jgi:two-component system, sporulation sensor kinase E
MSKDISKAVLDGLQEGVVAFDSDKRVILANRSAVRMMGWTDRGVMGEPASELFRDRLELLEIVEDGFCGNTLDQPTNPLEKEREDAKRLAVTTAQFDLVRESGLIMLMQDVSTLRRAEWEMFQVEKMSALGRLAASVAHEVRNPLGAIGIQLQLLEEDLSGLDSLLHDRLSRRLNIAQQEMKRLDRIVHNFLRFSRTPKLDLTPISLNDVVRHVFELVSPEAKEQGIFLSLALDKNLPTVAGDESQLGQAILNIIVNAFQAIEGEGVVEARTWFMSDEVCLTLSDTGCGIPQEEIDRIFEVYYTTRDEGTGLGLSIAQKIIFQHGGHIDLSSEERKGTRFEVHFPVAAEGKEEQSNSLAPEAKA